jgi:TP53 regulating kinase and related kinases
LRLVYRGAEADVFLGRWCRVPAVYKSRKPLDYRLPELDLAIRSQRTVREAQMIRESKRAGVPSPYLYYVSPDEALLVMQYIEGERLKAVLDASTLREGAKLSGEFGRMVATLHRAGIMHGDLTTSNVIVNDRGLHLIDFGLSVRTGRIEDQAVDLRLIKETLVGAHNPMAKRLMASLLDGYSSVIGEGRALQARKKLVEIERRGRYARVE